VSPPTDVSERVPDHVSVRCPYCGAAHTADVVTTVDAADDSARTALLSGQLNVTLCPACGARWRVPSPIMYYDLEKEVALVLVPTELGLKHEDQEREVGRLTNRVVDNLPPEQRRMYLLQPRLFFSEKTFLDAVLEATGIDRENLRQAQETMQLLDSLLDVTDPGDLRKRLKEHGREDDTSLVTLAALLAEEAATQGDRLRAGRLARLRDTLIEVVGPPTVTVEDIVRELRSARDAGELDQLVAALRPALTYEFFAAMTAMIESSEEPQSTELTELRQDVLRAMDRLEQAAADEMRRAARRLDAVLLAPDPAALVREQADTIDEAFLWMTEATLRNAAEQGQIDKATTLQAVLEAAIEVLEERMPPQARLINRLARASSDEERRTELEANREQLGSDLVASLQAAARQARQGGADAAAESLEAAARQAQELLDARKAADEKVPR